MNHNNEEDKESSNLSYVVNDITTKKSGRMKISGMSAEIKRSELVSEQNIVNT